MTDHVGERVLCHPGLRVVAIASAGTDHIDMEAARRYGVHHRQHPGRTDRGDRRPHPRTVARGRQAHHRVRRPDPCRRIPRVAD
ncbi:hypothetical protein [Nocardia rhamnosiphila]|uniref:D-isomer specific 2-hydroxyacid dehydrogenase catalytic domain-containing protein n=1 Tax=Nocardia rhamnosiphila TaxID=426716 RepID=A0ABV2X0R4_9NOCA